MPVVLNNAPTTKRTMAEYEPGGIVKKTAPNPVIAARAARRRRRAGGLDAQRSVPMASDRDGQAWAPRERHAHFHAAARIASLLGSRGGKWCRRSAAPRRAARRSLADASLLRSAWTVNAARWMSNLARLGFSVSRRYGPFILGHARDRRDLACGAYARPVLGQHATGASGLRRVPAGQPPRRSRGGAAAIDDGAGRRGIAAAKRFHGLEPQQRRSSSWPGCTSGWRAVTTTRLTPPGLAVNQLPG